MYIFFLVVAGVVSWVSTNLTQRYALKLGLVQAPNHRSSHSCLTPHGGGIGVVLGSTLGGILLIWSKPSQYGPLFFLALILAIVGLVDDIWHLQAKIRFGIQFILCAALIAALGFLPDGISPTIQFTSVSVFFLLLLFTGVWWINLYNFMDGIDGIAGGQAIYMLILACGISAFNYSTASSSLAWWLMLTVATATFGFLVMNWPPAKIFMGDVGSTYLAFIIYGFALISINEGWSTYFMWMILGCPFVVDATVTLVTRILTRQRWHEAHRNHAYQRLSRKWHSHRQVTLLVLSLDLFWLAPLATLSIRNPQCALGITILAYVPVILGALALGAGRQDNA
ncbi:glycosyltransferase family 4 protein [Chitinivorax sp. PXF-14]|uniref:MraY family glycosyltransferase n=1 Tax=Chitinivorax sp. PXF-14 TaxID=3230488 RepID=UPI003466E2DB